ncbi:response regulator [Methyloversatilis sp.]|uniref:response regulator n=1 Tax=Methyloversatilis sp. TaxID=2569862 RepID=UPI003F718485
MSPDLTLAPARTNVDAAFRLLVVDDDLATIRQLGSLLTGFAQVSFATCGEDALAMARTQRPDLILLDAEMPGLNGFEVFKALRADPVTAAVPVVFATSHTEPEVEAEALRMGAADFISKPLVASQVLARVRRQLQWRGQPATDAAAPLRVPQVPHTPRVLIVDDDPATIQLLQGLLAEVSDCYFALDGTRALEMAAALQPDLLVLDIDMPGLDGFEVCRRAKIDPPGQSPSVAFVTQHAHAENEALAFESGADDFIGKPFDTGVLLARVCRLIDRKRRVDADLAAVRAHWQGLGDARVAEVVAAASDAIVVADDQGCIVLANRAACTMFGVAAGSAVGQCLPQFLPAFADAGPAAGRQQVRQADGGELTVELVQSALGTGRDRLHTCVLRDTSARDREEAVQRRHAEVESASKATAGMLSFIAHEMGNSLNAVLGFSHLALSDLTSPLPPAQLQRIERIAQAAGLLQALMRDVIDLNRLEAGKFRVETTTFDPAELVRAACSELALQAEQAGAQLRHDVPAETLHVRADARRLQQCLHNLVSNAVKYGRPDGRIDIALHAQGDEVLIEVRDDGPGLTDEQLLHLFEPFNRLGREGGKAPGSGLGLVLTRELATAMGGRLEVDSVLGAGSCFTLRFARIQPQP